MTKKQTFRRVGKNKTRNLSKDFVCDEVCSRHFARRKLFFGFANFRARNFKHSGAQHFARQELCLSLQTFVHENLHSAPKHVAHQKLFLVRESFQVQKLCCTPNASCTKTFFGV